VTSTISDGQNNNLPLNISQSTFSGTDVSVLTAVAPALCASISIPRNECALVQSNAVAIAIPAEPAFIHPPARTCITSNVAAPALIVLQLVIRQTIHAKTYNGSTNYKHYKEYFETLSQVNGWTTEIEKAQNLSLALEGSARDVLKDVSPTSLTPYSDTWIHLARRFGWTDSERDARRRFESCRQHDTQTLQEFEQTLRLLNRDAFPDKSPEQRDVELKVKFEEGVHNTEFATYLRLHARNDDFAATVLKTRQYGDAADIRPAKKAVRITSKSSDENEDPENQQPTVDSLLQGFRTVMSEFFTSDSNSPARIGNWSGSATSSSNSNRQPPHRQGSSSPSPRSPPPPEPRSESYANCIHYRLLVTSNASHAHRREVTGTTNHHLQHHLEMLIITQTPRS